MVIEYLFPTYIVIDWGVTHTEAKTPAKSVISRLLVLLTNRVEMCVILCVFSVH